MPGVHTTAPGTAATDRPLARPEGHVDVWQLALPHADGAAATAAAMAASVAVLAPDEHARARRQYHAVDRVRSLFARASLRRLLGAYLGLAPGAVALREGAHGKPLLADAGCALAFNTSHCGDWVLHAFGSGAALGIDIERPPPHGYDAGMLRLYLTARERARLAPLAPAALQHEALRLWAHKEAWLKALGTGLSADPAQMDLADAAAGCSLRALPAPPGHVAALARLGPAQPVRWHRPVQSAGGWCWPLADALGARG